MGNWAAVQIKRKHNNPDWITELSVIGGRLVDTSSEARAIAEEAAEGWAHNSEVAVVRVDIPKVTRRSIEFHWPEETDGD